MSVISHWRPGGAGRSAIFITALGYYDLPAAAFLAYAEEANKHYGEFARFD